MQESFNSLKAFMQHKHQCHNSSMPTKLGQMEERIAITQTTENHATLTQFITQSQTFVFFFFSYFCTMTIPQTDSEFSQFHIFLNQATLLLAIFKNWENVKFGLGDHGLVFECDIFNASRQVTQKSLGFYHGTNVGLLAFMHMGQGLLHACLCYYFRGKCGDG
jgi:hypothetical protein